MKTPIVDIIIKKFFQDWFKYFKIKKPVHIHHITVLRGERSVVFFFADRSSFPFAVAKVGTTDDSNHILEKEYSNMQLFRNIMPIFFNKRAPKLLFKINFENEFALIISYCYAKKTDFYFLHHKKIDFNTTERILNSVMFCWDEFISCHNKKICINEIFLNQYLVNIEKILFNFLSNEESLINNYWQLKDRALSLSTSPTFLCPVHGDFWKNNILINDNYEIYLIDWERSKELGFPIFDIHLFLFTFFPNDIYIYNCLKSYQDINDINKLARKMLCKSIHNLAIDFDHAGIMLELFLYEMIIQGPLHCGKPIDADKKWQNRLIFFLNNKDRFLSNYLDCNSSELYA